MFELTIHFKHEMIGLLPNIHSNFELSGTSNFHCYREKLVFKLMYSFQASMLAPTRESTLTLTDNTDNIAWNNKYHLPTVKMSFPVISSNECFYIFSI